MHYLYQALLAARDAETPTTMLDILVEIAEHAEVVGQSEQAAEILALALCYPMRHETRMRAEGLFIELETRLYPRVIYDARQKAQNMTLEDMVTELLAE